MGKAGGIIGLLAGLLGMGAAITTLFFGGLGSAFEAEKAETVVGLGWGGILFSLVVFILGIVAIFKHKIGGYGLILFSTLGAIFGGTLVAICMAFSLIGGILSVIGSKRVESKQQITQNNQIPSPNRKPIFIWGGVGGLAVLLIIGFAFNLKDSKTGQHTTKKEPFEELIIAEPSPLRPEGELGDIFNLGSNYTDLQRENKLKEIKGKVVQWTLPVYEISKISDNKYRVQTSGDFKIGFIGKNVVGTFITITVRNEDERKIIETLKTGDKITFKGIIAGSSLRNLKIEPAILYSSNHPFASQTKTTSLRDTVELKSSLLKLVCKKAIVVSEKKPICNECPIFTSNADFQGQFSIDYVLKGKFFGGQQEYIFATYSSDSCEPHSSNWGGYMLFSLEGNNYKLIKGMPGHPGTCKVVTQQNKEILTCESSFMAQGVIETSNHTCIFDKNYDLVCKQ